MLHSVKQDTGVEQQIINIDNALFSGVSAEEYDDV